MFIEHSPDFSQLEKNAGKTKIILFENPKEMISMINLEVSINSLNITLSNPLACSIIVKSKSPSGAIISKFLVNFDHPTFLEEEVKVIKEQKQNVILVCYRSDSKTSRLLESQLRTDSVEIQYISSPVEENETTIETIISFDNEKEDEPKSESNSGKIFLIFLFAFIFILIIVGILFLIKKLNKKLRSQRKKLNKTSNQNIASYPEINSNEEITSNPYQDFQKYILFYKT